jgi:hypothetical protein
VGKGEDEDAVSNAGKGPPGGDEDKLADKAGTGSGKAPPVIERPDGVEEPSPKAEDKDLGEIDSEVEHLDKQLGEIDSEIDDEEADLSKIDDDIEGIIDELDSDRKRD